MKTKTLIVLFIISFFISCQKTKSDPILSLRTRKNRVVGEWRIKSGRSTYTETYSSGITSSEGFTFTESAYKYVTGSGASTQLYTGGHSLFMKFDRKGGHSVNETLDGHTVTYKGRWDFNAGTGTAKAKEKLLIHYDSYEGSSGIKTYRGTETNMTFEIIELRNKLMIIHAELTVKNPDGSGYSYNDYYEMVQ